MSEAEQIKPCPNCERGGCYEKEYDSELNYVECPRCGCRGPVVRDKADAIPSWNSLPRREDFHAELMELVSKQFDHIDDIIRDRGAESELGQDVIRQVRFIASDIRELAKKYEGRNPSVRHDRQAR